MPYMVEIIFLINVLYDNKLFHLFRLYVKEMYFFFTIFLY